MSPRRVIHGRHLTESVTVAPWKPDDAGWFGTWQESVEGLAAQVQSSTETVIDTDGARVAVIMIIRLAPTREDLADLFTPRSQVEHAGHSTWVLSSRWITRQGLRVYLEVKTGENRPDWGGWRVDVVHERSAGRDRRGNPTPVTRETIQNAVFVPGSSTERSDRTDIAVTTSRLMLPPSTAVASTDTFVVEGPPSTIAGRYEVIGDPAQRPDRTIVELRRS